MNPSWGVGSEGYLMPQKKHSLISAWPQVTPPEAQVQWAQPGSGGSTLLLLPAVMRPWAERDLPRRVPPFAQEGVRSCPWAFL